LSSSLAQKLTNSHLKANTHYSLPVHTYGPSLHGEIRLRYRYPLGRIYDPYVRVVNTAQRVAYFATAAFFAVFGYYYRCSHYLLNYSWMPVFLYDLLLHTKICF